MPKRLLTPCPCGHPAELADCCGRWLSGRPAPDAESLMRSRYTAYTLLDEAYVLATWHPDTRPERLDLAVPPVPKWLGLKVVATSQVDENHAMVAFVARYKLEGRGFRLNERSWFEKIDGRWYYEKGDQLDG